MLRIEKDTPGVLDLSAVKDELGNPITLNGACFRNAPDSELDNPVLQRVRDVGWVRVTREPLTSTSDSPAVPPPPVASQPPAAADSDPPNPTDPATQLPHEDQGLDPTAPVPEPSKTTRVKPADKA